MPFLILHWRPTARLKQFLMEKIFWQNLFSNISSVEGLMSHLIENILVIHAHFKYVSFNSRTEHMKNAWIFRWHLNVQIWMIRRKVRKEIKSFLKFRLPFF